MEIFSFRVKSLARRKKNSPCEFFLSSAFGTFPSTVMFGGCTTTRSWRQTFRPAYVCNETREDREKERKMRWEKKKEDRMRVRKGNVDGWIDDEVRKKIERERERERLSYERGRESAKLGSSDSRIFSLACFSFPFLSLSLSLSLILICMLFLQQQKPKSVRNPGVTVSISPIATSLTV